MGGSFWGGMLLALVIAQLLVIWSIRRHRDPTLKIDCDAPIEKLMPSLSGLTLGTAVAGNRIEVHENGAFFDVLIARIRAARRSVHFETFLWKDGQLGRRVADALIDRARAGVSVRVMLDAQGSKGAGKDVIERMRNAGCCVTFFHQRALRNIGVLNDRDHRKLVIVDGREAFTGGHCIVDDWLGNAEDHRHVADVSVELHGPIVHSLQGAFSENWAGETGELFLGEDVFPSSDNPMVQHAGHRNFEKLLRCGVRLFEYPYTLLHQKIMTVDGAWSAIGSSNFDDRSFEINDEISLSIADAALAARLDAIFETYVQRACEIDLDSWTRRGWWHKAKDNAYYLLNELL